MFNVNCSIYFGGLTFPLWNGVLSSHVFCTNLFITRCLAISLERYQQLATCTELEITTKNNRTTHACMIRDKRGLIFFQRCNSTWNNMLHTFQQIHWKLGTNSWRWRKTARTNCVMWWRSRYLTMISSSLPDKLRRDCFEISYLLWDPAHLLYWQVHQLVYNI